MNELGMVQQAALWAAELHADEVRDTPNPLPYVTHVMEVASNLRYTGGVTDEEMLAAAFLHDAVESFHTSHQEVDKRFGKRVSELVKLLTREEPTPAQTKGMTKDEIWQLRSDILLGEIEKMSKDAMAIKLADRLANLREALLFKKGDKLTRYLAQTNRILEIVPRTVNPGLWTAIRDLARQAK
ncbi:MAG: bifunctional (p)ppGpp synthetase/guanosine-3',5'-bis(diphosphate) 3'-pyrophosphohydrolase [Armatimonadetes bacterium]|nr:bifunctional (p)ppGpp synthetase/guanosine-3',5'-bis(diphosphate) 3'-pyrophosphohydrolase [Armatimonadota bacterium]